MIRADGVNIVMRGQEEDICLVKKRLLLFFFLWSGEVLTLKDLNVTRVVWLDQAAAGRNPL